MISRSITNLRTSTEEAESQKALAAAEAGIEQALKKTDALPLTGSFESGDVTIQYNTDIVRVEGTQFLVNGGNAVAEDDGADIWLSEYKDDDTIFNTPLGGTANITIFWGESSACSDAALEIVVLSGSKSSPALQRYTAEPCADPRRLANNFDSAGGGETVDEVIFQHSKSISVTNGLIIRITPIYYDAKIGVVSTASLPLQGKLITSTGESGKTQRRINVFQGYPKLPSELFPYAIFSPKD